ncbi:uncharacterized protein Spindly [Temnothorax nylanderi]|uniref:uncharacterized protein Spindly n=1 Tax=Temnothorax nylanderi TaxID=102681 RepID=UPI003A83AE22
MAEMSELYGESANDTKIEEHLEESLISQDDYKKLKQENESYRQELHVLRMKLEASDAVRRDLEESNEALEKKFTRYMTMVDATRKETIEKYTAAKQEYENQIADLETNIGKYKEIVRKMQDELRKYMLNEKPCQEEPATEETLVSYKQSVDKLTTLLCTEQNNVKELKEKLANLEEQNEELSNNYQMTLAQLMKKEEALENAQETARELAASLKELELSRVTPASDTCKGNSLFAEVEDRRQLLLDKMKILTSKYNEVKRMLKTKMSEIKLLRAEKNAMARKWEIDVIDTLQENADLLNQYKRRIFELENKLKSEIIKNNQMEEMQSTDDSFNYARSLLVTKGKEIMELNEKIERQAMQILVQEEANHNISRQLRCWRSKAMSLETQILAIKAHLEAEQTNDDNKALLEAIESCKISGNENFEETSGDSGITPDIFMPENNTHQGNSTKVTKEPVVDSAKEFERPVCVRFAGDTEDAESKDIESKPLKKQAKQRDYPVISYTENDT